MDLQSYLSNLNNMSWQQLHNKIISKYWSMGNYATVVNQALSNYNWADKAKVQQLFNWIDSKIWQYMAQQQRQKANTNQTTWPLTNNNTQPAATVQVPRVSTVRHQRKEDQYQMWYVNGQNSYRWTVQSYLNQMWSSLNNDLKNYWTELNKTKNNLSTTNMNLNAFKTLSQAFQAKAQNQFNVTNTKLWMLDTLTKTLQNQIWALWTKYKQWFDTIQNNLNNYKSEVKNTFANMTNNINKIWEDFKKKLNFDNAAAASTAEKTLRWATGKWAQLRVANYIQSVKQNADKTYADLDAKLNDQKNQLQTKLLDIKSNILQDQNLNETNRLNAIWEINTALRKLATTNATTKMAAVDDLNKVPQEALNYRTNQLEQKDTLNYNNKLKILQTKWEDSPTLRHSLITNIVNNLKAPVPSSIISKAEKAPDAATALNIIRQWVQDQTDKEALTLFSKKVWIQNAYVNNQIKEKRKLLKQSSTQQNTNPLQSYLNNPANKWLSAIELAKQFAKENPVYASHVSELANYFRKLGRK